MSTRACVGPEVGIIARVVPDSYRASAAGDGKMIYRVSLSLLPNPLENAREPKVCLANWPSEALECARMIALYGRVTLDKSTAPVVCDAQSGICANTVTDADKVRAEKATKVWQRLFAPMGVGLSDGFEALAAAIKKSLTQTVDKSVPPADYVLSYSPARLARQLEDLHLGFGAAELLAHHRAGQMSEAARPFGRYASTFFWRRVRDGWFNVRSVRPSNRLKEAMRRFPLTRPAAQVIKVDPDLQARSLLEQIGRSGGSTAVSLSERFERALQTLVRSRRDTNVTAFAAARDGQKAQVARARAGHTQISWQPSVHVKALPQTGDDGYFASRAGIAEFWAGTQGPNAVEAAIEGEASDRFTSELVGLAISHIVSRTPAVTPGSADTCSADQLQDLANSKLVGIQSLPSLAKFMSLTLDLEFTEAQLAAILHRAGDPMTTLIGFLAVDLLGPGAQPPQEPSGYWTAYAWRSQESFLPATLEQTGGGSAQGLAPEPHNDGLLDLQATVSNNTLRYQLINMDASAGTMGFTTALHALASQTFSPAVESTDFTPPQARTRGIALLDLSAAKKTVQRLGRFAGHLDADPGPKILHSEDLVVGFRPDVALATKEDVAHPDKEAARFRSLTRRIVETGEFALTEDWIKSYLDRDDGLVRTPTHLVPSDITVPPVPPMTLIPHETIATWTGESIAVRPRAPREGDVALDAVCDLALNFKHDTPGATARPTDKLPPLRFGHQYWFGARLVYINGSSIPFERAVELYARGNVLGATDGTAFPFKRYEPVGAPDVLIPLSDPIVKLKDPAARPGEHALQLVVRTSKNNLSNDKMHRYIVPIRAAFDVCELHGLYDQNKDPMPEGAFTFLDRMPDGSFPMLKDPAGKGPAGKPKESVRATVLRFGSTHVPKTAAYYPDPWGRGCTFAFAQGASEPAHYSPQVSTEFWKKGGKPSEALPILLTLQAAPRRDPAQLGTLRVGHTLVGSVSQLRIIEATVELSPAETVDLWIWCNPDGEQLAAEHWMVGRAIALAAKEGENAGRDVRSMMLGTDATPASTPMPIPSIAQPRVLTLVHAVDRPLQNPTFELWDQPAAEIVFNAIAVAEPSKNGWEQYIGAHTSQDIRLWLSEESASTFFFAGSVNIDRASTSDLRCEVRWLEFDEGASFPRDRKTGKYSFHERPETKVLFQVSGISANVKTFGDSLDLLFDEDSKPRMLTYKFPTARARRLQLRLVATSRFTAFFPVNGRRDADDLGVYETHSSPMSSSPYEFWVLNTVRPDTPVADFWSPPIYDFDGKWSADGRTYLATSSAVAYRIWHPAGFYSSGEGTTLGVSCLTEAGARAYAQMRPDPNEIMEKVLGPLEQYVTRWGTDPYVVSGGLEDNIGIDRFANYEFFHPSVPVLLSSPTGGPAAEGLIDVVAYKPQFDADVGKWFFDVAIDPGDAYFPWVRLKLVRFQPHSIYGHQISLPQQKWVRVPPKRHIRVEFAKNRTLLVEVSGVAYLQAGGDPMLTPTQQALANAPSLWVLIQEAVDEGGFEIEHHEIKWKPCLDQHGQKMLVEVRPEAKGKEVVWVTQFELPEKGEPTRFGLHLQETQYMAADGDTDQEARLDDAFKTMKFDLDLKVR
jgi:hypothetical protein